MTWRVLTRAAARRPRPGSQGGAHVLLIVENVALARDHRLQKQVGTLSASGYRVTVICRADPGNHAYSGARVHAYPAPADATSKLGFVREYAYSLLMAGWLTVKVFLAGPSALGKGHGGRKRSGSGASAQETSPNGPEARKTVPLLLARLHGSPGSGGRCLAGDRSPGSRDGTNGLPLCLHWRW